MGTHFSIRSLLKCDASFFDGSCFNGGSKIGTWFWNRQQDRHKVVEHAAR